jgi:hypothetical protein
MAGGFFAGSSAGRRDAWARPDRRARLCAFEGSNRGPGAPLGALASGESTGASEDDGGASASGGPFACGIGASDGLGRGRLRDCEALWEGVSVQLASRDEYRHGVRIDDDVAWVDKRQTRDERQRRDLKRTEKLHAQYLRARF